MKYFIKILLLTTLMACGSTQIVETNPGTIATGPEGVKAKVPNTETEVSTTGKQPPTLVTFSDATRMKGLMGFLADDALKGRDTGSEGIEQAAVFIEKILEQNGIAPYFDSYRDTLGNYNKPAYNIVGVLEGTDPELKNEFIIIGAHYDHIGIVDATNGDAIANGANDNASGTATVLELARYFGNAKPTKRSLIFALFSAEEKGLLGSWHLARKLREQNLNLYTVLNFEMTGVPMNGKDHLLYLTGYDKSNLAEVSNAHAGKKVIGFLPTAAQYNLFERSDNFPFYEVFKIPAHTFATFDFTNFDHYHQVGDELDILDLNHMAHVVNTMLPIVEKIANAPEMEISMN